MSTGDVFIGVGSNIEPERNIEQALEMLAGHVEVTGLSLFYTSKAVGTANQADFVNGAFKIRTVLEPAELKFNVLRRIEADLGRKRTVDKNAARTIDLDILLYGSLCINEHELVIPDPMIITYPFVAVPILDIERDVVMPARNIPLATLVDEDNYRKQLQVMIDFTKLLKKRWNDEFRKS